MKKRAKKMAYAFGWSYRSTLFVFLSVAAGIAVMITGLHVFKSNAIDPPTPEILKFTAQPSVAKFGQRVTLEWSAKNADVCILSNSSVNTFPPVSKYTLAMQRTKTFKLTCINDNVSVEKELTVEVEKVAQ